MNKIVCSLILSGIVFTLSASTGVTNIDSYVRQTASTKSKIVALVGKNTRVEVLGTVNNKKHIWYKTSMGYIYHSKIDIEKETPPESKEKYANTQELAQTSSIEILKEEKKVSSEISVNKMKKANDYFVGLSLNYNQFNIKQANILGVITLNKPLDENSLSSKLEIGKKFDSYVVSANYEILMNDDVSINSLYLSFDYQFDSFLNPFIGVSAGWSQLSWERDPLETSNTKEVSVSSMTYGLQAGIEYKLYERWSLHSIVSYKRQDLKTTLIFTKTPAEAEINYQDRVSIGLGIRYFF